MTLKKILVGFVLMILVNSYLFPIQFTFLPPSINSKMLLGVFGIFGFAFDSVRKGGMRFSEYTLIAGVIAAIFSVWCLFSVTASNSTNYIYCDYIVSFLTWMAGAYGVYTVLRLAYGTVDLPVLTRYLALVAVFQCVTALLIDNVQGFSDFVDSFMYVEDDFYKVNKRMYGIGAALDPGGIRFSAILVMIAHQLATNEQARSDMRFVSTYMIAYATTILIGSVISRTTLVGAGIGLGYILVFLLRLRKGGFITTKLVRLYVLFFLILTLIVVVSIFLYNSNEVFRGYLRFGFEAFFNWVETGEFRTDSTDTLIERMWIWPDDLRTWLIGQGTFGIYDNNTDIGYCNFVLYCGLIGLAIFSAYFLYCHLILNRKFKDFWMLSLILVALTFIFWIKVTTDIFYIDALLFCISGDYEEELML